MGTRCALAGLKLVHVMLDHATALTLGSRATLQLGGLAAPMIGLLQQQCLVHTAELPFQPLLVSSSIISIRSLPAPSPTDFAVHLLVQLRFDSSDLHRSAATALFTTALGTALLPFAFALQRPVSL